MITDVNGCTTTHKNYIYFGGKLIAVKDSTSIKYFQHDTQGNIIAISNASGDIINRRSYTPFGEIRSVATKEGLQNALNQTNFTNRGYTTHEHLENLELIHMNGRVYDPTIGRFMSADPYIQSPYNTQSYNRYSYVMNNPVNLIDPSGYFSCCKFIENAVRKIRDEAKRGGKDLIGGILIVGGLVVMVVTAPTGIGPWVGASMIGSGAAIVNGEDKKMQIVYGTSYGSDDNSYGPAPSSTEASMVSSEGYFDADITYNHKNMNGGATESFLAINAMKNSGGFDFAGYNSPSTRIQIVKNLSVYTPIDYATLDPQVKYALWAQSDMGMEDGIIPFIPFGGGMKIVNSSRQLTTYYPSNSGFLGNSIQKVLKPGTLVDRVGHEGGKYLSPVGTPIGMRALPPHSRGKSLNRYEVIEPLRVDAGFISPAFDQLGLGIQYKVNVSIKSLVDDLEILRRLDE